jgi:hypothetical protein
MNTGLYIKSIDMSRIISNNNEISTSAQTNALLLTNQIQFII